MEFVKQVQPFAQDGIAILNYLLPGLLVAWLVHVFTDYERPSPFDQVVHALLALLLVRVVVAGIRGLALWAGRCIDFGTWTATSDFIWSVATALFLGLLLARLLRSPRVFAWSARHHWRLRPADTPVWLNAFDTSYERACAESEQAADLRKEPGRWVTLVLADERRISGWPRRYPADPTSGHVTLTRAKWLVLDDKKVQSELELVGVQEVLIPASDIKRVEFLEEFEDGARVDQTTRKSAGAAHAAAAPAAAAAASADAASTVTR